MQHHKKQRRLVVVSPDGKTTVYSEDWKLIERGDNILPRMLQEGWKEIRQAQSHTGGVKTVLVEKEEE